jgi:hypothetical protein
MAVSTRRDLLLGAAAAGSAVAAASSTPLPAMRIGPHTISRLIVGGNPVSGNSHFSGALDAEMREYFTAANVKKMLAGCERAGITTWQSRGDVHIVRLLQEYRQDGGRIQWIAQTASELGDIPGHIRKLAATAKPIGIYNHGNDTDKNFKAGTMEVIREHCKAMRDSGVLVGVGTHNPEVIDYVESQNWDVDFYMTCMYNMTRSKEEAQKLAGGPIKGELFHDPDREKMLTRVRQVKKPCLIFKVYGAGRNCDSPEKMLDALRLVFQYAKPNDPVVIGMFPKLKEQANENCRLVLEALNSARQG